MNVLIMGAAGSGKGTMAEKIIEKGSVKATPTKGSYTF